ncbi:MAG TPA: transposase [Dehalococcoidia bacterium]|nr:transposase [Dehalococcoidia bacterium]
MSSLLPTRKRIRLAPEVYQGPRAFSVTISTANRRRRFDAERAVNLCLQALTEIAARQGMEVLAYCFMPDHLHLLLEAKEEANLIRFMKTFKQLSAYRYRQAFSQPLWQKGYYEHILRKEEDVRLVAQYLFGNPVRAGLVNSPDEYAFSGGSLFADLRAT